ncbi:WD40/YVTN/BNR-like repeat-containing protein [Streptomyces barringtoniae]|uniref:WD40/YVTN/BNR-like repeat-containing protein n=1 Tax=Streptomyces barringtoniae TaxID=2892029 RepID=UPI001E2C1741|nr:glycosyl hydrolase [Streptomyces barringtoniae]MCC5474833.1 glycosyl hydrolase [Streptomyces barringtoniae]
MSVPTHRRRWFTVCALTASAALVAIPPSAASGRSVSPFGVRALAHLAKEREQSVGAMSPHVAADDDGGNEADEIAEGADQYAEARTSPGVVAPGAYGAAWRDLGNLRSTSGRWHNITDLPYNSDDPRYRDIDSNSSGGGGNVTGRMAAVAADDDGYVYAGSAGGGVWRSHSGGGHWQPISDRLPAQSTGALALDGAGRLWLGTGEATTNADAYLGSGVYVLTHPHHGTFSARSRVGGDELESTTIHELRFGGDKVWAATSKGVWSHSTRNLGGPWKLEYAPNPDFLPGGSKADDPSAPYKNIANDIAIDPKDPSKVVLAVGWRSGDEYNGFYTKVNGTWTRITSGLGDLPADADNVGNVTFARSADGSRYYAIDQSPEQLNTNPDSGLEGIYVSKSGSPAGPWTKIADYKGLAADNSALTTAGYMPGVQAWYNQFLAVDPSDPQHVYAGLEEVYETKDGGADWSTVGPYWNFTFSCWSLDPTKQTGDCNPTTHSDQHGVAIGRYHGKSFVYVGNDGGIYKRPVNGRQDASGHATDWTSLNDGTIDTLQYYSVGVGKDLDNGGLSVTGGLQDNGQSILRGNDKIMGSNFGGDGGDTLTDPANGCDIAQEYVYLAVQVTQNCAVNDGSWATDPSKATSYSVAPPDNATSEARFIAPLGADMKDGNTWVAGGRHIWVQTHGYAIRSGKEWTSVHDFGAGRTATAVAVSGGKIYAAWCGPCNNQGFARGIAVGNADGTGWHDINLPVDGTVPNRYLSGFAVDPKNADHVFLAVNGFSRHWTEGPGAGVGHVFESTDGGTTWKDISANLPDVPTDSALVTADGGLAVATDLGVVYRAPGRTTWQRIGSLPAVAVLQLKTSPDGGTLYAATHGRGIYTVKLCDLR